jgi:ankyrin repeat protein
MFGQDPLTLDFARAIRSGDVDGVSALLAEHPELATERFGDAKESRSALHLATDWPANFPRIADTIGVLIAAGAEVDAPFVGTHDETALHWAASADDVAAVDALLDAGADIDAPGAVLTGGTPLSDAVIFGKWAAARRLVERGAAMTIWQAAALGEMDELAAHLAGGDAFADGGDGDITNACWHACRAGRLEAARLLVDRGADIDWLGYEDLTARQAGIASGNLEMIDWLQTV